MRSTMRTPVRPLLLGSFAGRMWNAANLLTLSRFAAAPVFVVLLRRAAGPEAAGYAWATLILTVATLLTDMLDGLVARRQKMVTDFGKIMDPVADSTFFLTVAFAFAVSERFAIPVWIPLVVLYREIAMHVLRRYAALRGIVLAAKVSGKTKMVIQCVVLLGLLTATAASDAGWLGGDAAAREAALGRWALWGWVLVAVANVLSLPEYLREIPRFRATRSAD